MKTKTSLTVLAIYLLLASITAYPQIPCYPDVNTGQKSKATPVLAVYQDKLHMLHLGDTSNEIWYSSFDGSSWSTNVKIGQKSKVTPVMAVFNDKLHMLHLGDTSNEIYYSSFDGASWSENVKIGQKSKATPVLAFYQDKLHMLHLGDTSNEIWYSSFDGSSWSTNVKIGQKSKVTPVMAEFYGELHMLHLGDTSNEIWYSSFDGVSWSTNVKIGQKSKAIPVLAEYYGRLHMLHLGNSSNQIYYSSFDGANWSENVSLAGRSSKATPAFASINRPGPDAGLHIVHTGSSSNYIWYGILPLTPMAPSEVSFDNITKRSVTVSWKDNSDVEESFVVYRSLDPLQNFQAVGSIRVGCLPAGSSVGSTYSFENTTLKPGTTYYYRISAVNFAGNNFSEPSSFTTLPPEYPASPTGLRITGITATSISIAWEDNADNEVGFEIKWDAKGVLGESRKISGANRTSYDISPLYSNTEYCIKVRAYNEDGFSLSFTEEVCAVTDPAPPTTTGYASVEFYNCHTEKRAVRIWTYDVTINNGMWVDRGELPSQYSNSGICPAGSPLVFSLEDGHIYEVVAIDINCGNSPPDQLNASCRKSDQFPIQGKSGGCVLQAFVDLPSIIRCPNSMANTAGRAADRTDIAEASFRMKTYPNPFRHRTSVEFRFKQEEDYSLDVYDIKGSLVQHLQTGKAQAGILMQATWEPKQSVKGMYFIRLVTRNAVQHLVVVQE